MAQSILTMDPGICWAFVILLVQAVGNLSQNLWVAVGVGVGVGHTINTIPFQYFT